LISRTRNDQQMIVDELLDMQVVRVFNRVESLHHAGEDHVQPAFAQIREFERGAQCVDLADLKAHPRILTGEAIDDRGQNAGGKRFRASDPDLADRRVDQVFDVPDALPQLVECNPAALEEGMTIERRFDAARAAVQKPHSDGRLEIGDRLGNDRLRHAQLAGGAAHGAGLNDGEQHMEIPQSEAAADPALPFDAFRHSQTPM
jgi:hypothetical protein